jgi:hypothetical protein
MIMDLQAYAKLLADANLPVGECRTIAALNHIAGAAALIASLAGSARDLNDPHLLESFDVAHSGLERAWLALANTWGSLSQETVEGTPDGRSPFLPLPERTGGEP